MPAISASRAVSRSIGTACCMSAIDRGRSSRCSPTAPSARSPRCRRASRHSTFRSGPTTASTFRRRRWVRTTTSTDWIRPRAPSIRSHRDSAAPRALRSTRRVRSTSSRRWRDRTACIAYRPDGTTELVVAGQSLVGVAFDPNGGLVVTSNDTAYRLNVPIRPLV